MELKTTLAIATFSLVTASVYSVASEVSLPKTFVDGDVLHASELNGNFEAVKTSVDDNDSRINDHATTIADYETRIAELEEQVAALIAANQIYTLGATGPAGGIVFYITDGGQHGFEAAPVDQDDGDGVEWGCSTTGITGANSTAIYTGETNTNDILSECSEANSAASLANNYSLNGYTDWFLPSKDELNLMYENLHLNGWGGFSTSQYYWSSSEDTWHSAWAQWFNGGWQDQELKDEDRRVRAMRVF